MKIVTTAKEMSRISHEFKVKGNSIGFVPTMGALHEGHASLIKCSKNKNNKTVVSVFVNPSQFNDLADLTNYPRTFEQDKERLESEGVDVMFYPSVKEVYPVSETKSFELDGLDSEMEGPNRPGHFNGVIQVVTRLFDLVQPDSAFFGKKDFQQLAIIRHMSKKFGYPVEIVGCPTLREPSGLAMSSRNMRLTDSGKCKATEISRCLNLIKEDLQQNRPVAEVLETRRQTLKRIEGLKLEYLEFVEPTTLQSVNDQTTEIQACVAAYVEGVRLIDNMRVK